MASKLISFLLLMAVWVGGSHALAANGDGAGYEKARWHPIHFKPAIDKATNEACLSCHREVIEQQVLEKSPAGVKSADTLAWYQTLDTYKGEQETFHRRHLVTPLAKRLMEMKCNTCHQGHDPREAALIPANHDDKNFTLRKSVNPEICLMCHGGQNYKIMGLPSPWNESGKAFNNNCLLCHSIVRPNRHQVNFLRADAIEQAAKENSDTCYGCHGGRKWYRISYPYPRHPWKGMAEGTPEWAKDRSTESEPRFRLK